MDKATTIFGTTDAEKLVFIRGQDLNALGVLNIQASCHVDTPSAKPLSHRSTMLIFKKFSPS